jgi:hypothetical protein
VTEKAYRTLGLEPGAGADEIRAAYRRLAKRNHPDKFTYDPRAQEAATARMKAINAAYKALRPVLAGIPPPAPAPPRPPPPPPRYRPPMAHRPPPVRTARRAAPDFFDRRTNVWRAVGVLVLMIFLFTRVRNMTQGSAGPSLEEEPWWREMQERRREADREHQELLRELNDPRISPEDRQKKLQEYYERRFGARYVEEPPK